MRRGFKAEAGAIAREVRRELNVAADAPLDMPRLADHLGIPVLPLSALRAAAPAAVDLLKGTARRKFSGVTVFDGSRRTIVFNDAHARGRQASDIAHELAHGLLFHAPGPVADDRGCRLWNRDAEEEADWLAGTLLIPDEAALLIERRGWSDDQAATAYGVSVRMIRYRRNVSGARRRVDRARARRTRVAGSSVAPPSRPRRARPAPHRARSAGHAGRERMDAADAAR